MVYPAWGVESVDSPIFDSTAKSAVFERKSSVLWSVESVDSLFHILSIPIGNEKKDRIERREKERKDLGENS